MKPDRGAAGPGTSEVKTGILLVEDEELLRVLVERYLENHGFCVFSAGDGVVAVQLYQEYWREIQIVISDIDLPNMNGVELFQRIKAINPEVQAIVASGSLDVQLEHQLLEAGVKRFLWKPYGPEEILKTIREVLEGKRDH